MEQIKTTDSPVPNTFEKLKSISLSDYRSVDRGMDEWIEGETLPPQLQEAFIEHDPHISLFDELLVIRKKLFEIYGEKRTKAQSFEESRFSSLSEILEKGLTSCGALTNVFGNILRYLGVPVKFIHGVDEYSKKNARGNDRHAWLEIYDPRSQEWMECDPTKKDFLVTPGSERWKVYHNWHELKVDYEKGNF